MSQQTRTFKGHHGTSNINCKSIKANNFTMSPRGWLGPGVYFFDDDKVLARYWASRDARYKQGKVEVLECILSASTDVILDIVDPKSEQSKKVNEFRENFLKGAMKNDRLLDTDDRFLDGKILNMLCTLEKYSIVRNSTHTLTDQDRRLGRKFSHICNAVEICVRDLSVISIV